MRVMSILRMWRATSACAPSIVEAVYRGLEAVDTEAFSVLDAEQWFMRVARRTGIDLETIGRVVDALSLRPAQPADPAIERRLVRWGLWV